MTPDHPTPTHPGEILTGRRLGAANGALSHTTRHPDRSTAHLHQRGRHAICQAHNRSPHPLVAAAHRLLDQCDKLADDDRTAGLLLFAQLTRSAGRRRDTARGVQR